jgi:acyl-CoA reductase-like NAD-dependent aldehyde dehydrogenase
VVPRAVRAAFLNSGQACNAPTRLLVPRADLAAVERLAVETVARLRVGAPADPATDLGPLIGSAQHARVTAFVRRAVDDGARLLTAVDTLPPPYMAPVVLSGVDPDQEIAQEEIFGPVLVLIPHDGDADAVRIANGTQYGLSAEVWSSDPARIAAVAAGLRCGQVKVNGVRTRDRPDAPFGGFGVSGIGRELGSWGLAEFLEVKAVLA